ncbi:MAG: hypothetical protein ACK5LC_13040 [Coprobacillaceae bacterium]
MNIVLEQVYLVAKINRNSAENYIYNAYTKAIEQLENDEDISAIKLSGCMRVYVDSYNVYDNYIINLMEQVVKKLDEIKRDIL